MVRSYLKVTLASALAWNGMAAGQSPYRTQPAPAAQPIQNKVVSAVGTTTPAAGAQRHIYVDEPGKGKQKCLVLREWTTAEGRKALEVQAVNSGEVMTILMPGPVSAGKPASSRVFHWTDTGAPPPGAPVYSRSTVPSQPARSSAQPTTQTVTPAHFPAPAAPVTAISRTVSAPAPTTMSRTVTAPTPTVVNQPKPTMISRPPQETACVPCQQAATQPASETIYMRPADVPDMLTVDESGKLIHQHGETVTAQPARQPFWRRMVSVAQQAPTDDTAPKTKAPTAAPTQKAKAPASQAVARTYRNPVQRGEFVKREPARTVTAAASLPPPTDIRQSWGKPSSEPAQETAKVKTSDTVQAIVQAPDLDPPPMPAPPPPAPAVPESTTSLARMTQLPKAAAKEADPLLQPESFSHRPEINNEAPRSPLLTSLLGGGEKPEAKPAATPKRNDPPGVASTRPNVPLGAASVMAAYGNNPGQVVYLPVPVVTMPERTQMPRPPAITSPPPTPPGVDDPNVNAFTMGPQDPMMAYQQQMMQQQQMAAYQQMMAQQQMMHQQMVMQQQMAMGQNPDLVAQQHQLMQRMAQAAQQGAMPVAYQAPAQQPPMQPNNAMVVQQLMQTLKEELMPSQREWAAEALASVDGRLYPQAVEALVTSSREDLAGSVRAACIRSLARMKVNSSHLVPILQGLRADTDPRVRHEAEQVLASLGVPATPAPEVQPVGGTAPEESK